MRGRPDQKAVSPQGFGGADKDIDGTAAELETKLKDELMDPLVSDDHTANSRRKLILIVEGDFLTRWTAAEYLRETGFDVIEAVNSAEALAALRAGSAFDAVFCDVMSMSDTAGPEFLDWLEKRPALPVVLVSDSSDYNATLSSVRMRSSITKPYEMSEVERRLRALLSDAH